MKNRRPAVVESKHRANAHERHIAKVLGGQLVAGSGGLGSQGDVRTDRFLVECKSYSGDVRLKIEDIRKICDAADEEELLPAIAIRVGVDEQQQDWIALPDWVVRGLLENTDS